MSKHICIAILGLSLWSNAASAWGDRGHEIVGQIAEESVKPTTRDWVRGILGLEPLAVASTFPDHVRSDARFSNDFAEYHYCEIPTGSNYDSKTKKYEKDCFGSMSGSIEILKSPVNSKTARVEKQIALRYLAHVVGDIANPLHVGNGLDRGGNYCRVRWTASRTPKDTNLHAAWDESLVEYLGQTFADPKKNRKAAVYLADYMITFKERYIDQMNQAGKEKLGGRDMKSWLMESQALRESGIYPTGTGAENPASRDYCNPEGSARAVLDLAYAEKFAPVIESQLLKSGLRLAATLDAVADHALAAKSKPPTLSEKEQEEILRNVLTKFKNQK